MSGYRFRRMSDEEATQISGWHYEPPYDFYDATSDQDDLRELLDPKRRKDAYFSVFDEDGVLVGFFQFERAGKTVDVGLGMRPDLTGQGLGMEYLLAGLEFARECFSPDRFTLSVATFNERASGGATSTCTTPTAASISSCRWPGKREAQALRRAELPESARQSTTYPAHGRRHCARGGHRLRRSHPLRLHVGHFQGALYQSLRVRRPHRNGGGRQRRVRPEGRRRGARLRGCRLGGSALFALFVPNPRQQEEKRPAGGEEHAPLRRRAAVRKARDRLRADRRTLPAQR